MVLTPVMSAVRAVPMIARRLILIARGWQLGPSRILPPTCRYAPSCSEYAIVALRRHGAIKGGWLATKRLLRCHPWGGQGYDPVPLQPYSQTFLRRNETAKRGLHAYPDRVLPAVGGLPSRRGSNGRAAGRESEF